MNSRKYTFVILAIFLGACSTGGGAISSNIAQNSLLISSAKAGDLAGVTSAINSGANINTTDELGNTALHYASEGSFNEIVTFLLENGAEERHNINSRYVRTGPTYISREITNNDGYTPLMLAYINMDGTSHDLVFQAFLDADGYGSKEEQLLTAAEEQDLVKLKNALLMNVDKNTKDNNGNTYLVKLLKDENASDEILDTALEKAIPIGNKGQTLENILDVNILNNEGESAIVIAVSKNHDSAADKIVNYDNSDPYAGEVNGDNALHLAAKMDKSDIVTLITSHNSTTAEKIDEENDSGDTAISLAISNGASSSIVSALSSAGANINIPGDSNPLLSAIEEDNESLALTILDLESVNPYVLNNSGETSLIKAIKSEMTDLVDAILEKNTSGVNVVTSAGTTALIEAARKGNSSAVSTILSLVDQSHKDLVFEGKNALMHACKEDNADISQLLVSETSVANLYLVNAEDSNNTALHYAAKNNHDATVAAIVTLSSAAEDINKKDTSGNTPLMLSTINGNVVTTATIFEVSDDSYRTDTNNSGKTAIELANTYSISSGSDYIFAPFLELGTDISNIQTTVDDMLLTKLGEGDLLGVKEAVLMKANVNLESSGMTPLMRAADNGHGEIVDHLILSGADKDIKSTTNYETALIKAIRKGHEDIAISLLTSNNINYEFGTNEDTAITYAAKYSLELPLLMEAMLALDSSDINHVNLDFQTALSLAASLGHSNVVEKILAKNPIIDYKDGSDISVLMHAINSNDLATVDNILGGNQNGTKPNLEILDGSGYTALMVAANKSDVDLDIVKSILNESPNLDTLVGEDTALTLSIIGGRIDIARELVSNYADPYKRPDGNTTSNTALHLASVGTTADQISLVIEILANSPIETHLSKFELLDINGKQSLELALAINNTDMLKEFFYYRSQGLDISAEELNNSANEYLLSQSTAVDLLGVKLALNLNGGDISHVDGSGDTALIKAASVAGSDSVIEYLLSLDTNKTNYLIENNLGETALQIANSNGYINLFDEFEAHEETSANDELMNAIRDELDDATAIIKVKHAFILGADINYVESDETPLIAAVKGNRSGIVTELLANSTAPDFDVFDASDKTALMNAIDLGYISIAEGIVNAGADIYVRKDNNSRTALHHAVEKGNTTELQNLVDNIMGKTTSNGDESKAEYEYLGKTAFYMAVDLGRVEMAERMADANLNPYVKTDETNTTPLILASYKEYSTLVGKMLANTTLSNQEHTDGIELSNISGNTALMEAAKIGNGTIVDSLLGKILTANKLAYVKATNSVGNTALIIATINNKPTVVTKLLNSGADKNVKGENDKTAINHVNEFSGDNSGLVSAFLVNEGYSTVYEKMFEHSLHSESAKSAVNSLSTADNLIEFQNAILLGATDIDTLNESGESPLIVASKSGSYEIAEYIVDNKSPTLDIVDNSLNTALMHSISNNHLNIAIKLVAADANIYLMVDGQSNPLATNSLILASQGNSNDHVTLVTNMISKTVFNSDESKINLYNTDGKTSLMVAAELGFDTIIKEILLAGSTVDVNLKSTDVDENTALIYATTNNKHLAVRELLGFSGIDNELTNSAGDKALKIANANSYNNVIAEFVIASGYSTADEMLLSKASAGDLLGVKNSLLMNADKDTAEDGSNETALIKAAKSNTNLDVINHLISPSVDVNKDLEASSKTALMFAIDRKNADGLLIADALIEADAALYVGANSGTSKATALTYAANMGNDTGHVNLLNAIIAKNNSGLNFKDTNTNTALIVAAKAGYDKLVDALLTAGADKTLTGEDSKTALGHAVVNVKRDVIKELLKREKDPVYDISTDELLVTALNTELLSKATTGSLEGTAEEAEDLVWLEAINLFVGVLTGFDNLNYEDPSDSNNTALHKAVIAEKKDAVNKLLALGAGYELPNNDDKTALALASEGSMTNVITEFQDANSQTTPNEELLEGLNEADDALALIKVNHALILGADKDHVDENGKTMLMLSAIRGHLGITTLLLNNPNISIGNYSPDLTSGGNKTSLHYAIENSKWTVAEYLVDNGATLDIKGDDNTNAIMEAVKHSDIENNLNLIDKMLTNLTTNSVKAKINEVDDSGMSALMHAAQQNHPGVVEKLLAFSDTDLSLTNNSSKTVVEIVYDLSGDKTTLIQKFLDHYSHATANAMLISKASNVGGEDADGVQDALWLGADIEHVLSNSTALHHAATLGYLTSIQKLKDFDETKFNAIVNSLNGSSNTALIISIKEEKWDVAAYLIGLFDDSNININLYTLGSSNTTALIEAIDKNHSATIDLILSTDKSGIALVDSNSRTALILMAISGYNSGITALLAEAAIDTTHQNIQYQSKSALMHAIENDNVAEAILLANSTVTIYETGLEDKTALHFASIKGYNTVVDQILTIDNTASNVNMVDSNGKTSLIYGSELNKVAVVTSLLNVAGVDIEVVVSNNTALMLADTAGYTDVKTEFVTAFGSTANTKLLLAATNNSVPKIKNAMLLGSDINHKDSEDNNNTALHNAVIADGDAAVAEILVTSGIDILVTNDDGNTAAMLAVGKTSIITLFQNVASGTDANEELLLALDEEDDTLANIKIENALALGADVDTLEDGTNRTALMLAAIAGRVALVDKLIAKSANLDLKDGTSEDEDTALILAIKNNTAVTAGPIVTSLVAANSEAGVYIRGLTNSTALIEASARNYSDIVDTILAKGTLGKDYADDNGRTALLAAVDVLPEVANSNKGGKDIVEALIAKSVNLELKNSDGNTALTLVSKKGYLEVATLLINTVGINLENTGESGKTAIKLASENSRTDIMNAFLLQEGYATIISGGATAKLLVDANLDDETASTTGVKNAIWMGANKSGTSGGNTALHLATIKEHPLTVAALIDEGLALDTKNSDSKTALLLSIDSDNADGNTIATSLINAGADIYVLGPSDTTSLIEASDKDNSTIIDLILSTDKSGIALVDSNSRTALILMAISGYNSGITALLAEADIDTTHQDKKYLDKTALMHAIENDNVAEAILLANSTVTIYGTDSNGQTPLIMAAIKGQDTVVDKILDVNDAAVNINLVDTTADTRTALIYAVLNKKDLVVKRLLEASEIDLEVTDAGSKTAIEHLYSLSDKEALVDEFLYHENINYNYADGGSDTMLLEYAGGGLENTVKLKNALWLNASINTTNGSGETALMLSSKKGYSDSVDILLTQPGIDLDIEASDKTALILAIENSNIAIASTLIAANAALYVGANSETLKSTALHYAAKATGDQSALVTEILEATNGSDGLDYKDENGDTALILASKLGYASIVDLLLTEGADKTLSNNVSKTALDNAVDNNNLDVIKEFLKREGEGHILSTSQELKDALNKELLAQSTAGSSTWLEAIILFLDDVVHFTGGVTFTDLNYADSVTGNTALHNAVIAQQTAIVERLLAFSGADPDDSVKVNQFITNDDNKTAFDLIADIGSTTVEDAIEAKFAAAHSTDANAELLNAVNLSDDSTEAILRARLAIILGASVDHIDSSSGKTVLMIAAENGYSEVITLLGNKGANLESTVGGDKSALMYALENDKWDAAEKLLTAGANPHTRVGTSNNTPMMYLASLGDDSVHVNLMNSMAASSETDASTVDLTNGSGETVAIIAAKNGNLEVLKKVVGSDPAPDLNVIVSNKTALMFAIDGEHWLTAEYLVKDTSASIYVRSGTDDTALMQVARLEESTESKSLVDEMILGTLINDNYNLKDSLGKNALILSAEIGNYEIVQKLVTANAFKNSIAQKKTALMYAIYGNNWDIADYLVDNNSDPYIREASGDDTALIQLAKLTESADVIDVITRIMNSSNYYHNSTNINLLDSNNKTALHIATEGNKTGIVEEILTGEGLQLETQDGDGKTAIERASLVSGNGTLLQKFLDYKTYTVENGGANAMLLEKAGGGSEDTVEVQNALWLGATIDTTEEVTNRTALMLAAIKGYEATATLLLDSGAAKDLMDGAGADEKTALMLAITNSKWDTADYLVTTGLVNPYTRSGTNDTALMQLSRLSENEDNIDLVERIITANITGIDYIDGVGDTASHIATVNNNYNMMEKILVGNPNLEIVNTSNSRTVIKEASLVSGNETLLQKLLDHKTYTVENGGANAMLLAKAGGGSEDTVEVQNALWLGATIDTTEAITNRTALMLAAIKGYDTTLQTLIDNYANLDLVDSVNSNTAIMLAVKEGNSAGYTASAGALITAGANLISIDNDSKNVLHHAAINSVDNDLFQSIIDTQSSLVSGQDSLGKYPLHYAVTSTTSGNLTFAQKLLVSDSSILGYTDNSLSTPMHYAASSGDKTVLVTEMVRSTHEYDFTIMDGSSNTALDVAHTDNKLIIANAQLLYVSKGSVKANYDTVIAIEGINIDVTDTDDLGRTPLINAVVNYNSSDVDRIAIIDDLLSKGVDINIEDDYNKRALDYANDYLHNDVKFEVLESLGYTPSDSTDPSLETEAQQMLFNEVVLSGDDTNNIENALLLGADVNAKDVSDNDRTALMKVAALSGNRHNRIAFLLNHGADVTLEDISNSKALALAHTDNKVKIANAHLLYYASEYEVDNVTETIAAFSAGAEVNTKTSFNDTALILASANNNISIVNDIIDFRSPDIDLKGSGEKTALINAANGGYSTIVDKLLNSSASIDLQDSYGITALMAASSSGSADIVENLLNASANIDLQDSSGNKVYSHIYGNSTVQDKFLTHLGYTVGTVEDRANTMLINESNIADDDIAGIKKSLLLGANVDSTDSGDSDRTALHKAAINNRKDRVYYLLDSHNADRTIVDYDSKTAYQLAIDNSYTDVEDKFVLYASKQLITGAQSDDNIKINNEISYGADINYQDEYGYTALHYAAEYGYGSGGFDPNNDSVGTLLLVSGINISLTNNSGETAAQLATNYGWTSVAAQINT